MSDTVDHAPPQPPETLSEAERLAQDTTVPEALRLPARSKKEEWGGHLRNWGLIVWGIVMAVMFGMPSLGWWERSVGWMDAGLWPLIAGLGRVWGVVVLAALTAGVTMLLQYVMGDMPLMREVQKRTEALRDEAAKVPLKSPRDMVLTKEANKGAFRIAGYGFTVIGALMGPMVLVFLWIPVRVDAQNVPVDGRVEIAAKVDGAYTGQVRLGLPEGMTLKEMKDSLAEALPVAGKAREVRWVVVPAKEGAYPVEVEAGEHHAYGVVRVGAQTPPGIYEKTEAGKTVETFGGQGVVQGVTVSREKSAAGLFKLGGWEVGWLWVYMVVYIPVMMGVKKALRIP